MLGRIVEIAKDHRHLSLYRGFMCIEDTSQPHDQPARKLGRIAYYWQTLLPLSRMPMASPTPTICSWL